MTKKIIKKAVVAKKSVTDADAVTLIEILTHKVSDIKRSGRETWLVSGIVYSVSVIMQLVKK